MGKITNSYKKTTTKKSYKLKKGKKHCPVCGKFMK